MIVDEELRDGEMSVHDGVVQRLGEGGGVLGAGMARKWEGRGRRRGPLQHRPVLEG